jgi:hypothetical protein
MGLRMHAAEWESTIKGLSLYDQNVPSNAHLLFGCIYLLCLRYFCFLLLGGILCFDSWQEFTILAGPYAFLRQ